VNLRIEQASADVLAERAAWRYPPPYDFYDDDGVPPYNPERFYGAYNEDDALVGFFYFERHGDAVRYGLGLRPDLTGRGLGEEFVRAGVHFAERTFGKRRIVLDVAAFNERAIKVYERVGFRRIGTRMRSFQGSGVVPFVDMERPA
jgi:[ribosomal protein S18]-alanine N-acetyltransferase